MTDEKPTQKPRSKRTSWLLALADLGVLVHVLGGAYAVYCGALHWIRTGHPTMPLAEISVALWAVMIAYFVATLGLLISWLVSLQRTKRLREAEKWAWALGMCFVPLVGIVYHVRHFRAALRKENA